MSAPALVFLAPPPSGGPHDPADPPVAPPARDRDRQPAGPLRMTRGARQAAEGMRVTDADVQECLDAPDDATPDERTPSRTHFRRGRLVVLAAADGTVLRVDRRRR
ncbi:hypothetical protein SAMN05660464_0820 [Geodermatophilus dictyosporus]|uniref:Uncharacterized protein n=1 Tax=Geodermatophilus dictyosporus TaxID=1523247 RepID=A0A1I5JL08_9ACTN|nr:hypothetical protein [Geodermatophilus dictyosporus]SFO73223.1 hypothetical protein SAMN05660464_0820 [Geodermatophilus dictyosporus]